MSTPHPVVTNEEWLLARKELLAQEKRFSHLREQLSEQRRALPWRRVEQQYTFQSADGQRSFSELFAGKSQLVVYHLMFAPEWDAACTNCSFWGDGFSHSLAHLAHRDVSFAAISRAPVPKLAAYAKRMGWTFPWLSSEGSSFNFDMGVSFTEQQLASQERSYNYGSVRPQRSDLPGFSVFLQREPGVVFHTYSCFGRGIDMMNATYQIIDLVPKGRDEAEGIMRWLRRHDEYEG